MFGNRFSSSTSCSRSPHETESGRPNPSLSCCFLKVATHPLHAVNPTFLRILLQNERISQIYFAADKSLFAHVAISLRDTLEICECRRACGATPSGHGTATFPTFAENFDLCATPDSE